MLVARSSWSNGGAGIHTRIFIGRRVRCHVVLRHGVHFDSRFFVGDARSPDRVATIHLVWRGALVARVDGVDEVRAGPVCHVLPESQFERVDPRGPTFRMSPERAELIDLCVPLDLVAPSLRRPALPGLARPVPLDDAAWRQVAELVAGVRAHDDDAPDHCAVDLLLALEQNGVLAAGAAAAAAIDRDDEPAHLVRLWRAVASLYERQDTAPVRKALAHHAGLSLRQLSRDLVELNRRVAFSGWREATRVLRLRRAVLLLTAPDLTARDVAGIVGYGSVDAMARAFRDARLPAPMAVRRRIVGAMAHPIDGPARLARVHVPSTTTSRPRTFAGAAHVRRC